MIIFIIKIIAILTASFLSHYPIKYLMGKIGEAPEEQRAGAWLGRLERMLYMGSWFLGYPQFIGIWLAAKVVGKWGEQKESRTKMSIFMFGAGLSIAFAVTASLIIDWIVRKYF